MTLLAHTPSFNYPTKVKYPVPHRPFYCERVSAAQDRPTVSNLLADIATSPTPYHAAATSAARLEAAGFGEVQFRDSLPGNPGRYYTVEGGSLVAWVVPEGPPDRFTVVGAHTDSPNLRVRSRPDVTSAGWAQVGVEVYGGVLLNSWLDRDLGLAGRVTVNDGGRPETKLFVDENPVLRVPQLAIHLDREIREKGLKLNPQTEMTPLWAPGEAAEGDFLDYVADHIGVSSSSILTWDVMAFDTQPPAIVGRDRDLIASARIDNLFSSFCGTYALASTAARSDSGAIAALVLFDHEEVGSESATGASGAFFSNVLERIASGAGMDRKAFLEALARSYVVSADGAHATHPNFSDKHEPNHHIQVNAGVVVKRNSNQRYASDANSEGPFRLACESVSVPVQTYIHRNDLPCGSTIGPITSAQLGVRTIDVGAPQLAMHSARETAGVADAEHLADALTAVYTVI